MNRLSQTLRDRSLPIVLAIFVAVALLMVFAYPASAVENRDAVAVIIGNKAYTGDTPEVDYAYNDADAMRKYVIEVLGYREGNIIFLRDATLGQLQDVFGTANDPQGRLFDFVRPGESDVTVFYSGHGVPGLIDRRGYLLPIDGNPSKAENTGYSFDVLQANLAKLPARSVQVFIDACFSGNSARGMLIAGTSGIGISPVLPEASASFVMLTAASGDQVASWDRDAKHGLFTKHLLAALNGDADSALFGDGDGTVNLAEVEKYLDRELTFDARRRWGRTQTADVVGDRSVVLAALPPPAAEPAYAIEEVDDTLVTLRNANVRAAPTSQSERLETLPLGTGVNVTGRVEDREWYRVALAGGKIGFVWAPLLGEAQKPPQVAAIPQAVKPIEERSPPSRQTVWQVVLDEGITLGDWVLLSEDRLSNGDFVELLIEADRHVRDHGDFPQVREVLYAAVLGDVRTREGLDKVKRGAAHRERFGVVPGLNGEINAAVAELVEGIRIFDTASARAALEQIAALERVTGENLELLEKEATARHVIEDFAGAQSVYSEWLQGAPPDHPRRRQVAAALLKARTGERLGPRVDEVFRGCPTCPEMVVIPPGTFMMGSPANEEGRYGDEAPQHRVSVAAFAMGKYEVTFAEWDTCVSDGGCNGYRPKDNGWGRGQRPVVNVSWKDAKAYATWLSRTTGKAYRLPSEAEWEYAARAGTTSAYFVGNSISMSQANYSLAWGRTVRVGSFPSNAFGLYDTIGNVSELVEDCYRSDYRGAPKDGRAWPAVGGCGRRVVRGGSWLSPPMFLRAADRASMLEESRRFSGFRVAMTLSP